MVGAITCGLPLLENHNPLQNRLSCQLHTCKMGIDMHVQLLKDQKLHIQVLGISAYIIPNVMLQLIKYVQLGMVNRFISETVYVGMVVVVCIP